MHRKLTQQGSWPELLLQTEKESQVRKRKGDEACVADVCDCSRFKKLLEQTDETGRQTNANLE